MSNYADTWDQAARQDARCAIYATSDSEAFEAGGRRDADYMAQWVTRESVVLDVGCGIGRIETYLAPHCKAIHAVDISPEMLHQAGERLAGTPNVALHCASATSLSFAADDSFDFAFAVLVMHHLEREDMFLALCELHKKLKGGARALLQYPCLFSDIYARLFVEGAGMAQRGVARVRPYTPDEVSCLLQMAGFEIERLTPGIEIQVIVRKPAPSLAGTRFEMGGERIPVFSADDVTAQHRAVTAAADPAPGLPQTSPRVEVLLAGRSFLGSTGPLAALRRGIHGLPVFYANRLGEQVGEFQSAARGAIERLQAESGGHAGRAEVAELRGRVEELCARVRILEGQAQQNEAISRPGRNAD